MQAWNVGHKVRMCRTKTFVGGVGKRSAKKQMCICGICKPQFFLISMVTNTRGTSCATSGALTMTQPQPQSPLACQ